MERACERYTEIFKAPPLVHGAAGWQMNVHALRLTQRMGFEYCSDGRGTHPHLPVWNAELDPLPAIADDAADDGRADRPRRRHARTTSPRTSSSGPRSPTAAGHVFTLHAELEGMRLAHAFDQLLAGWKAQGWTLGPLRALFETLQPMALPRCETGPGTVPGRSGTLFVQRAEFLGDVDLAQAA